MVDESGRTSPRKWKLVVRTSTCRTRDNHLSFVFLFFFIRSRKEFSLPPDQMKIVSTLYGRCLTSEEKPSDLCFYLFKDKLNFNELRINELRIFVHSHSIYINVVLETISRRRTKLPPFLYESNYRKLLNKGSALVSRDLYSMFVLNDVSTTVENPGCLELNPLE